MKKVLLVLILGILLIGIVGVYAKSESANPDSSGYTSSSEDSSDENTISSSSGSNKKTDSDSGGSVIEASENSGEKIKETQTIELLDENQNQYTVTMRIETKNNGEEEQIKIKVRNVEINSDVEVEQEGELLKAKLSNGNNQEIKIMPDTASQTAIEKLQMKGVNVVLKEVGEGNNLSVVYEADGNKTVKFLGLFKVKAQISAMISAENGEVLRFNVPWWYAFAFGKGIVDCDENNLDLCEDVDECDEAGLIWFENNCIVSCPTDPMICEDNVTVLARSEELNCEFNIESCPEIIIPVCDLNNLNLCLIENDCLLVNGTWNNATSICE